MFPIVGIVHSFAHKYRGVRIDTYRKMDSSWNLSSEILSRELGMPIAVSVFLRTISSLLQSGKIYKILLRCIN